MGGYPSTAIQLVYSTAPARGVGWIHTFWNIDYFQDNFLIRQHPVVVSFLANWNGRIWSAHIIQCVGEGPTPFPGLLHFTLDSYLILPSVKQGGIKYHFGWKSLVWHNLGLNTGLLDHWRTLYPLGQWARKQQIPRNINKYHQASGDERKKKERSSSEEQENLICTYYFITGLSGNNYHSLSYMDNRVVFFSPWQTVICSAVCFQMYSGRFLF